MRIAYHVNSDGAITQFYSVDKIPPKILEQRIIEYERGLNKGHVFVAEFAPGSIEEHLFLLAKEKNIKLRAETLRDLERALDSARDLVCVLLYQAERGGA